MVRLKDALMELWAAGLDRHTAVTLFRAYAGPAAQHTLRTSVVSPDEARQYDLELAQAWSTLLGRCVSAAEVRFWLPARFGGIGALSAVQRAGPCAWASWASVMPDLCEYFEFASPDDLLQAVPAARAALAGLHARIVELGAPMWLSTATVENAIRHRVKTSLLMGQIQKKAFASLMGSMSPRQLAFHRTLRGPGSAAFLEPPLEERYVMSDARFTLSVCRRLCHPFAQCPVAPARQLTCTNTTQTGRVCGAVCDPDGAHLECCSPGGGVVARHDNLVSLLATLAKRGMDPRPRVEQVVPQLQARVCGQVSQARLDVIIHDATRRMLVDVTVVSPYAGDASFINACSRRDGHAARRAAVAKRRKYEDPDLLPFAVETGGRLGADAKALLHAMAAHSQDPVRELGYLYRAVSSTLQDGVARQLEKVLG